MQRLSKPQRSITYLALSLVVWAVLIAATILFQIQTLHKDVLKIAHYEAYNAFVKDSTFRRWASEHGGVYVPVTEKTPPNPYLEQITERDIVTPSGRKLTLMNPAYMTRQVHELESGKFSVLGHITSLDPIRPENAPDAWEKKALLTFAPDSLEFSELTFLHGKEHYRYMHALVTEPSCLKCHGHQGYKVGDIRGGISVSLPMDQLNQLTKDSTRLLSGFALLLWGTGSLIILLAYLAIRRRFQERERAEKIIRQKNTDLIRANQAKSQFVANISHEIRTPLNAIVGIGDLLASTALSSEQKELLKTLDASADLLLSLLDDVLDITTIEAGALTLKRKVFYLDEILREVIQIESRTAASRGLELKSQIPGSSPALLGDPTRIQQIFLNLISNSIKFTATGSITVSVSLKEEENTATVKATVQDTGMGIEPEKLSRIFERFEQADPGSTRQHGGVGLGLAICKALVEAMNGRIKAQSTPGIGSTFSFTLTLPKSHLGPEEGPAEPTAALISRLLLVEDNPVNQMITARMLEAMGCQVQVAGDGQEALQILSQAERPFELILMDIQMPVMDGLQTTRQIRKNSESHRNVPIIALTAHASQTEREHCLDAGMDDFLSKPVRQADLRQLLERWSRQKSR